MERVYTIIFLVGVIYTLVTFLIGGLFDFAHIGGHIDSHLDIHMDGHVDHQGGFLNFTVFPIKPITVVAFITVFGGVGILGTHYNFNAIYVLIVAILFALMVSYLLYKFVVVPLYKAQNTSAVCQIQLIGMKATVISPILENGFGQISYVVHGSKYDAPAQHVNKMAVKQGEEVIIYEIKENLFYVQPLNESN